MTGLQCHKRLWFDVNSPIKQFSHILYIGNRFGVFARDHYGEGFNLEGEFNLEVITKKTAEAINNPLIAVIYEAAFIFDDILVRSDVLLRDGDGWKVIEMKSSTNLKSEHLKDAAIQTFVMRNCGLNIHQISIAHVNKEFEYKGDGDYVGLIVENDVTKQLNEFSSKVHHWAQELKSIISKGAIIPTTAIGLQCEKPYPCQYKDVCINSIPPVAEIPIELMPRVGKALAEKLNPLGLYDLREIPDEDLKIDTYRRIKEAHITGKSWLSEELKVHIQSFGWPRYFMDFETVQQGVPIFPQTKPYQGIPFQWSVHKWSDHNQQLGLTDGYSFLGFDSPMLFREFALSLIETLGHDGPIFAHNAPTEFGVLKFLIGRLECSDIADQIAHIMSRVIDTLPLVRGGYYSPAMMGSFSIKDIVKTIPTTVDYVDDMVSSGNGAQIAWFQCTDPSVPDSIKSKWEAKLKDYCAKDTLAMVDLIRHLEGLTQ